MTGVAGFIGSHLLETLLELEQNVVGLDNFLTGRRENLEEVQARVQRGRWARFRLIEGDIQDLGVCRRACEGVGVVLHQAALGSVPRSLTDPLGCHHNNVTGFLNMLLAAQEAQIKRFVYASSSSVYGDAPEVRKVEDQVGKPLSPYAASKAIDEVYAGAFARAYDLASIGLRYFNVFGPRQDPQGEYAAVIPKWIGALLKGEAAYIYGDGETSRDFCFIANVVQANLLAATTTNPESLNQVFNVAVGEQTTLNRLFEILCNLLGRRDAPGGTQKPIYREFRPGDVRHSLADISKARRLLGYSPTVSVEHGLELVVDWYRQKASVLK